MPIKSRYLFVASMDVDADKEAVFNEVYDTEHVPNLLKVPGVHAVARMEGEPFAMSIGGEEKRVTHDGPRHSALYEIDGPHVLVSREWAKAVEAGRWPSEVRPFTRNRRQHALPATLTASALVYDPSSKPMRRLSPEKYCSRSALVSKANICAQPIACRSEGQ